MTGIMTCTCAPAPNEPVQPSDFVYLFSTLIRAKEGPSIRGDFSQCQQCGLVRLNEEFCLTEEDYQSDAYRESVGQPNEYKFIYEQHQHYAHHMVELLDVPHSEVIVDVGAGAGNILDLLKPKAAATVAIEPNPAMAEELAKRHGHCSSLTEACGMDNDGKADRVLLLLTLEHVYDPWLTLRQAAQLLKQQGKVDILVPMLDTDRAWLDKHYREVWFCVQHRWYFTPASLGKMLNVCGFNVDLLELVTRGDGWLYLRARGEKA